MHSLSPKAKSPSADDQGGKWISLFYSIVNFEFVSLVLKWDYQSCPPFLQECLLLTDLNWLTLLKTFSQEINTHNMKTVTFLVWSWIEIVKEKEVDTFATMKLKLFLTKSLHQEKKKPTIQVRVIRFYEGLYSIRWDLYCSFLLNFIKAVYKLFKYARHIF